MGCASLDTSVVDTSSGVAVRFLDAQSAHTYLQDSRYDDVFSKLDYELRMKENFETRADARTAFWAADRTRDWSGGERHAISGVAASALERVAAVATCALPDTLRLVKAKRNQEFGAYHTVAGAVVMPSSEVGPPLITSHIGPVRRSIESTLLHELFHVYSRANPVARDSLYALLGFQRADTLLAPDWLAARGLTNPDAHLGYVTIVRGPSGQPMEAALVTYAESDRYEGYKGLLSRLSLIAGYYESGFVGVGSDAARGPYAVEEVTGFLERVGGLTDYTMAVDEVLADAFERLVGAGGSAALAGEVSPEALNLLEGMERIVSDPQCGLNEQEEHAGTSDENSS